MHDVEDLIHIFNKCFKSTYNTILVKGNDEPLYLPADENTQYNQILFAHGYYSSALHECAHWLIAGEERRKLVDYGYWYIPDGRTAHEQLLFQKVEIKPQALEWILSIAAGYKFHFSIDNLNGEALDVESFKNNVYAQRLVYEQVGLPLRAEILCKALRAYWTGLPHCAPRVVV